MSRNRAPMSTSLFFAVLDGDRPAEWPLYGTSFSKLMAEARGKADPYAVTPQLLNDFRVNIEPILVTPEELLVEERLENVVGIIIDTLPKAGLEKDLKQKLEIVRTHVRKIKSKCQTNNAAMFKRFGYRFWFITSDMPSIADFVQSIKDMAGDMLRGTTDYDVAYITDKQYLFYHLNAYISRVYFELGSGR